MQNGCRYEPGKTGLGLDDLAKDGCFVREEVMVASVRLFHDVSHAAVARHDKHAVAARYVEDSKLAFRSGTAIEQACFQQICGDVAVRQHCSKYRSLGTHPHRGRDAGGTGIV